MTLRTPGAPRLLSVATAFPEHEVDAAATRAALLGLFPDEDPSVVTQLVERSGVASRRIVRGVASTLAPRDFDARNREYQEDALRLALVAARRALDEAGVAPDRVDALIDVSCTGIAIPALDTALAPALGLRSDVRRVPITESGCAAGALALGLAAELGARGKTTLVVAVELCSLTLRMHDRSRTNLVSCVLFGDGAGAAVVGPGDRGPTWRWSGSHLFPDSRRLMGFDVGAQGLGIVLDRDLPAFLVRELRPALASILARNGLPMRDVRAHWLHPGGRRILDAYEAMHELDESALSASRASLAEHGNLSSASIFSVIETWHAENEGRAGETALCVGIGPGLSLEASAWRWED